MNKKTIAILTFLLLISLISIFLTDKLFLQKQSSLFTFLKKEIIFPEGEEFRSLHLQEKLLLIREMTQVRGLESARNFIKLTYPDEPTDEHELIHVIGKAAFSELGYSAFEFCDSLFHFGCYHGVALEAVRQNGHNEKVLKNLVSVCLNPSLHRSIALSCIHGIGHGLMTVRDYDLLLSYQDCDRILEDEVNLFFCYDGVSMENVLGIYNGSILSTPHLNNPYYPCDSVSQKYESACVREHVYYARKVFFSQDTLKTAEYCLHFPSEQTRQECFTGMGSAINQDFFDQPDKIIKECNQLERYNTQYRFFCLKKAATNYAYARQFKKSKILCASILNEKEQESCFGEIEYTKSSLY